MKVRDGLIGKHVQVRPTSVDDCELFLDWREIEDPQLRSLTIVAIRPRSAELKSMESQLNDGKESHLTIERKSDGAVVGYVTVSSMNSLNRSADIELGYDPAAKKPDEMIEGALLVIGYLFEYFNLNSVFTQCSEANERLVTLVEELGFKKDGALRHRHVFRSEYRSLFVYSLLRYEFEI